MKRIPNKLRGMTLLEMLIAIGVVGISMTGFSLLFLRSFDGNKAILEAGLASASASRTVANTVREIREARQGDNGDYPLESGTGLDLKFYANADDDPETERVHYYLFADELRRGVADPLATVPVTYPAGDDTVTLLTDYVTNTAADPIFLYYNKDYPGDTTNNPLSTPVNVGDTRLIGVRLRVNIDPIRAPNNIYIESFAELRNLNTYAE